MYLALRWAPTYESPITYCVGSCFITKVYVKNNQDRDPFFSIGEHSGQMVSVAVAT